MRAALIALFLLLPGALGAQQDSLASEAERARAAWSAHDAVALVAASPRVLIQLPSTDPSAPVGRAQAAALLQQYLEQGIEVETRVRAAREVEPGRGYVELVRRYRVAGTQEIRVETLLLGYRLGSNGWTLVELRVVG
jgi:hypothetical protein